VWLGWVGLVNWVELGWVGDGSGGSILGLKLASGGIGVGLGWDWGVGLD